MSLRSKLIACGLVFALIAIAFGISLHRAQLESQARADRTYRDALGLLVHLQTAKIDTAVIHSRYAELVTLAPSDDPVAPVDASTVVEGLDAIVEHLRAMRDQPLLAASAEEIERLYYPLTRLRAGMGRISQRMLLRELERISDSLDSIAGDVRREFAGLDERNRRDIETAARRGWLLLGAAMLIAFVGVFFLLRDIVRALGAAVESIRDMTRGRMEPTTTEAGSSEIRELFAALREMQLHWQKTVKTMRSDTQRLDRRLSVQQSRFEAALNNMTQALCMLDGQFNLVIYNHAFARLFGDVPLGTPAGDLLLDQRFRQVLRPDETAEFEYQRPDGGILSVRRRGLRERGLLITLEDVTELHRVAERADRLASHDALTDVANRRAFRRRLEQVLAEPETALALFALDIKGFRQINDAYGLPVGDALLQRVADILEHCVGTGDMVARFGGDEFAVLQASGPQPEAANELAGAIVAAFAEPLVVAGRQVQVDVAIGIAAFGGRFETTSADPDELLQDCELALSRAKASPRSAFCFFSSYMREEVSRRRALETDLASALERGELELHYQPLVDTARRAVCGFEALLRWRHPERGLIAPGVFVPLAEELGLIEAIGTWALETACRQAADWPAHMSIAVNVSPLQVRSRNLPARVEAALAASGLRPDRLQIEVTESLLLDDTENVRRTLGALRTLGVVVAMDDFGTGYSSLAYLSRFSFSKIKIDQSFVRRLEVAENLAVVRAVIGLGKALGIPVIAEGVETEARMRLLIAEGCSEMQGYLFSKPRPAGDLPKMLAEIDAAWAKRMPPPATEREARS
ncbi:EAL domain-containing protein [Aurantimonas sp. MSK8Z-1]|uniref:putative bifunctional diguanylate cyclase/phosphodiesterase n=1 Tax=Mangrovibrevibacter kandeliae TaxID=2968473 RepID=UPI00211821AE|nr:EAL domain-containing protein [Aurantimonas sp. MSK8Z-1]MCW4114977.1 EAL domain-containing protein [Aurantimonas sp. MSK8Z-1]